MSAGDASSQGRLQNAIETFESVDGKRNVFAGMPVLLFLASAVIALLSFFPLIDLTTWIGLNKIDPVLPSAVSFVLLFVVFLFSFLALISLMEQLDFVNIRSTLGNLVSRLELSQSEAIELARLLRDRNWKHCDIINELASRLEESSTRSGAKNAAGSQSTNNRV